MSRTKITWATVVTVATGFGVNLGAVGPGLELKADAANHAVAQEPDLPKGNVLRDFNVDDPKTYSEFVGRKYAAPVGPEYQMLLVERADVAGKELALRLGEFRGGRGTMDILLDCVRRRLESQLDLVTDPAEVVKLYQGHYIILKDFHELNVARLWNASMRSQDFQQTRYAYINARLMYLKAAGQGPPAAGAAK